jgi:hypothetical protein
MASEVFILKTNRNVADSNHTDVLDDKEQIIRKLSSFPRSKAIQQAVISPQH